MDIIKRIKWSKEDIIIESKKYNHIKQFYSEGTLAYRAAMRRGKDFFNEITKHMGRDQNGHEKKYTDEYIIEQGSKYNTPKEFLRELPRLYERASFRKLLNKINYKEGYLYNSYTEDSILKECSEYDSPIDLIKNNVKLYSAAKNRGLLPKIKYKIGYIGSRYSRLVYVYEFSDNHFYCGLTYNEHKRHVEHFFSENTSVGKHIKKTGLTPIKKIISDGYIHSDDARVLEEETRMNYIEKGWISLNKRKCGGLGTTQRIWTIEKIYEEIKNIKTRKDLHKNGMYNAIKKFGIYYDIVKYIPKSLSKYIIIDTHTGIYYHSIQEAYNSSGYKLSVGRFGTFIKKNKTRYQIV